jgi:hypothetical protein
MGKERSEFIPKTRPFETFKMFTRLVYGVFIWYEFIFKPIDATVDKMTVTS